MLFAPSINTGETGGRRIESPLCFFCLPNKNLCVSVRFSWRPRLWGSGVKKRLQHRHLRRLGGKFIVPQAGRKRAAPGNQKISSRREEQRKKEEKFFG